MAYKVEQGLVRILATAVIIATVTCCLPARAPSSLEPNIHLEGWARIKGEVMLYDSKAAMLARDHSKCVSGVFFHQRSPELMKFDGKHVQLIGYKYRYGSLPNEDDPILPRKVLGASVISNFCLKDDVILIRAIRMVGLR